MRSSNYKISKILPTNVRLDLYTTYSIVMNEVENRSKVIIKIDRICESDDFQKIVPYTKEDLEKYWAIINSDNMYLKINFTENRKTKRYFILDMINKVIFIPLTNKDKNIVDYSVTNLIYLDKIENFNCHRIVTNMGKKYCRTCNENTQINLHEMIFGERVERGYKIDHKNSDGLDNRIENLRKLTDLENSANRKSDKLQGICWRPNSNKWESSIKVQGKIHYLGRYEDKIEAAKQYDRISVYLFPDIKQLNHIDGKTLLTLKEINEVKNNPQKYLDFLNRNKTRPLKNIRKTPFDTYTYYKIITKFFISEINAKSYLELFKNEFKNNNIKALIKTEIKYNDNLDKYFFHVEISKNFKKLEDAQDFRETLKLYIQELDQIEREKLEENIDNYRNEDGFAIIKMKKENMFYDVIIRDDDWLDFIHYSWWGSPHGYPQNDLGDLHILIFKKHFPDEYENREEGETIDHINRNRLDVTIENLRLADKSLQAQNTIKKRNSLIPYPCVHLSGYGFFAEYKKNRTEICDTAEEAARLYNEMAYYDNPNSRLNIIPDNKKTTIADLYSLENLKEIDIDSIKTMIDIKQIFSLYRWNKGLVNIIDK